MLIETLKSQPVLQHVSLDISVYKTDGEKPTFTIEITHDHPEGDLKLMKNGIGVGGGGSSMGVLLIKVYVNEGLAAGVIGQL